MKLNLKGWKKIVEEKDHSILRNKDNHELKILHKGLHPATRGQLASLELAKDSQVKMADGGSVPEPDKKKAKEIQDSAMESGWQPDRWVANAKAVVGMAEGGEVPEEAPLAVSTEMPAIPESLANPNPGSAAHMLPSGVNQLTPEQVQISNPGEQPYGVTPAQMMTPVEEAPTTPTPTAATERTPAAATPTPAPATAIPTPDMAAKGMGEIEQGLKREQAAIAAQAAGQQLVLQEQQKNIAEGQRQYKVHFDELENERKSLIKDINEGHIDPNHYVDSMSAGSKVATIIGLIAGGISSGVTGKENLAMKVLDQQIDRDIAAQKANLGKKETLLSANMRQFGNLKDAQDMTRVMQADIIANKMQQEAAKAASPQAAARLMQEAGKLHIQYALIAQKLAANKAIATMTKEAQADPSKAPALIEAVSAVDPARAKDLQGRLVPGMGFANTPDDAKHMKEINGDAAGAVKSITRLKEINKISGKSLSPELRKEAYSLTKGLVGQLNRPFTGGGPMSEGEQKLLDSIATNPTSIFALDSSNKTALDTLERTLANKVQAAAEARGLAVPDPIRKLPPEQQNLAKWARANPTNPKSAIVLKKLGLQ